MEMTPASFSLGQGHAKQSRDEAPQREKRDDFAFMTATKMLQLIRSKQISPVEIVKSTLGEIEASQSSLNAFVTITPELAMDAAHKAEQAVM